MLTTVDRTDTERRGKRQLRLSYGYEGIPQILRALEIMQEAASRQPYYTTVTSAGRGGA